jgi:hypothetical protein
MVRVNPPQKPVQAQEPPSAPTQRESLHRPHGLPMSPHRPIPFAIPPRGSITTEEAYAAYIEALLRRPDKRRRSTSRRSGKARRSTALRTSACPSPASNALRKRLEAKLDELEGK